MFCWLLDHKMKIETRLSCLEDSFNQILKNTSLLANMNSANRWKSDITSNIISGCLMATCVSTLDPEGRNRIQFYTPYLSDDKTKLEGMPWAEPIQTFGGFDDCGSAWVPPAGSTVIIIFQMGDRSSPFYMGTANGRPRGPAPHEWGYSNMEEYNKIWNEKRTGYLIGKQNEQSFPPWNTEQCKTLDKNQFTTLNDDPDSYKKMTYSHIYGFKTPGKSGLKMDDGDPKCNNKWSRMELFSRGGIFLIKNDHLHPCGEWTNPKLTGGTAEDCLDEDGNNNEKTDCSNTGDKKYSSTKNKLNKGKNEFAKRKDEHWFYTGNGSPENNKCELPQMGMQIQSRGGYQFIFDDSVDQPSGIPTWDTEFLTDGKFGCTDICKATSKWKSPTGHKIVINDTESSSKVRSDENGIFFETACGIKMGLNDHSEGGGSTQQAGNKRGFKLETSSKHIFEMSDKGTKQSSIRKSGGTPVAKAEGGYILFRTGYGIEIKANDGSSQEKTEDQTFQITSPQKDNTKAGPHFLKFEEKKDEKGGSVMLRAGGKLIVQSYGDSVEIVGDEEKNPSNKQIIVSKTYLVKAKNIVAVADENFIVKAKGKIFLLAGEDCQNEDGETGPCTGPALIYVGGKVKLSDKLYGSASEKAENASIGMFLQKPEE